MRFRLPEILLGALLTIAVFALGFLFASSIFPPNAKPETSTQERSKQETTKTSTDERIADYTWWLAVLTGGLVFVAVGQGIFIARSDKTARIAATAADLSARAAIASQAAVVFITDIRVGDRAVRQATKDFPAKRNWMNFPLKYFRPKEGFRIRIRLRNFGKTPAVVESICLDHAVADSLPDIPDYKNIIKTIAAIRPDERINITEPPGIGIENYIYLPSEDLSAIATKAKFLWIYGHIYFTDFLHTRHEIGFCGYWTDAGFHAGGPASYRYERSIPINQI
jgi:hypothetical protein